MKIIKVKLARSPYRIYIGKNILSMAGRLIKEAKIGSDALIISQASILRLHGKKIKQALQKTCSSVQTLTVPDSEESKSARFAFDLIEKIMRSDKKKRLFLVAFGGGVVGDLAGFIAAIYKRGIPYIQIPTTLLAQIDSAIGGKTAVDMAYGKNLVGAFYQPKFVLADVALLKTLPRKELLSGLSEAVKYAVIKDVRLFSFLEKNNQKILKKDAAALSYLIARCAAIKAGVVASDEFDKKGIRIILNFGHTIGHAIEAASQFRVSHGEAVSIGMICACDLSCRLGILKEKEALRIVDLIRGIGPSACTKGIKVHAVLKTIDYDKKFTKGVNRFVLIEKIGRTKIVENIPLDLIRKVIAAQITSSSR